MCPEVLQRTHCACQDRSDKTSMPAGVGFLNWTLERHGLDLDSILDGSCYNIHFLLLFHRLRVLQVGIVPFKRNIYKLWISTFVNSADPSWGRAFGIRAGVRQGCVLSSKLFCAVLKFAMSSWRAKIESYGLNLHDGMRALLDIRFADDLLVFATSRDDTIGLLEESVTSLGQVGLTLNKSKTKILTTQAQPGSCLQTSGGVTVEILDSRCAHK